MPPRAVGLHLSKYLQFFVIGYPRGGKFFVLQKIYRTGNFLFFAKRKVKIKKGL
jgi:hypothetical protein